MVAKALARYLSPHPKLQRCLRLRRLPPRTTPLSSSSRCLGGLWWSSSTLAWTTEVACLRALLPLAHAELANRRTGVLACLDGFMNIAMEQTEEYVNGQLKAKYGDAFIRGNNGATTRAHRHTQHIRPTQHIRRDHTRTYGPAAAPDHRPACGRSLVHFHNKTQGLMRPPLAGLALAARCTSMSPLVSACTPRPQSCGVGLGAV